MAHTSRFRFLLMVLVLFLSPILWRILFDEGEKLEICSPKTLDKKSSLW